MTKINLPGLTKNQIDPQKPVSIRRSKLARSIRKASTTIHPVSDKRMVVLLDASGSMGGFDAYGYQGKPSASDKMSEAKDALTTVAKQFSNLEIIGFGVRVQMYDKDDIMCIRAGGGTPMFKALQMAQYETGNRPAQIVLITDGQPTDASPSEILSWARNERPFRIYTIAIGNDADNDFLKELASISGGTFGHVAEVAGQLSQGLAQMITATAGKGAITL